MYNWLLSVPVAFGLESLAVREIRNLGYSPDKVEDGRISFYGDERAVCRANIWLRIAERVQIKLGDFTALSFTELFDGTKALPWPALLPPDAVFPVGGHSLSSKLGSVPDCQSIIKKAAVESMKARWKTDRFAETGALYRINFNIIRDRVTIYVDTSGDGLHKRGYRENQALTPIRETLAAALVSLSGWRPGKALWDPFCGSGTIPIEAAMMAANRAPGLTRRFAAENWASPFGEPNTSPLGNTNVLPSGELNTETLRRLFDEERAAAEIAFKKALAAHGESGPAAEIAGSDISGHNIASAKKNAANAGISKYLRFFGMDSKEMSPRYGRLNEYGIRFPDRGCIVTNPPYGERFEDERAAVDACRGWAPALGGFMDWNWCVISAMEGFEREVGRKASKLRKLNNGKIKCNAFLYWSR
jgi:putative N6-adenine-specific DNA methylase